MRQKCSAFKFQNVRTKKGTDFFFTVVYFNNDNIQLNEFFTFIIVEDGISEDWWTDATQNAIRKTKSAENIGIKPTIIVNR